ncbi:unnamed protein product [Caenorhabditis angaria]|uniref:Uncharacterized protein n=1 Tax=Caenorhabditis angaria TaxID=860376 RepID=A0A9P1N6W2_9PELO|nr:unnamed protein product [Caenorhabditis angaria]
MEDNGSIEYEMSWCFEPQHNFYADIFAPVVRGFLTLICVILGTICNIQGISSVHKLHIDKNRGAVLAVSMMSLAFWDTLLLVKRIIVLLCGSIISKKRVDSCDNTIYSWICTCCKYRIDLVCGCNHNSKIHGNS